MRKIVVLTKVVIFYVNRVKNQKNGKIFNVFPTILLKLLNKNKDTSTVLNM
jgi:hypothetical protein